VELIESVVVLIVLLPLVLSGPRQGVRLVRGSPLVRLLLRRLMLSGSGGSLFLAVVIAQVRWTLLLLLPAVGLLPLLVVVRSLLVLVVRLLVLSPLLLLLLLLVALATTVAVALATLAISRVTRESGSLRLLLLRLLVVVVILRPLLTLSKVALSLSIVVP